MEVVVVVVVVVGEGGGVRAGRRRFLFKQNILPIPKFLNYS